jgi:hypothetical protein
MKSLCYDCSELYYCDKPCAWVKAMLELQELNKQIDDQIGCRGE